MSEEDPAPTSRKLSLGRREHLGRDEQWDYYYKLKNLGISPKNVSSGIFETSGEKPKLNVQSMTKAVAIHLDKLTEGFTTSWMKVTDKALKPMMKFIDTMIGGAEGWRKIGGTAGTLSTAKTNALKELEMSIFGLGELVHPIKEINKRRKEQAKSFKKLVEGEVSIGGKVYGDVVKKSGSDKDIDDDMSDIAAMMMEMDAAREKEGSGLSKVSKAISKEEQRKNEREATAESAKKLFGFEDIDKSSFDDLDDIVAESTAGREIAKLQEDTRLAVMYAFGRGFKGIEKEKKMAALYDDGVIKKMRDESRKMKARVFTDKNIGAIGFLFDQLKDTTEGKGLKKKDKTELDKLKDIQKIMGTATVAGKGMDISGYEAFTQDQLNDVRTLTRNVVDVPKSMSLKKAYRKMERAYLPAAKKEKEEINDLIGLTVKGKSILNQIVTDMAWYEIFPTTSTSADDAMRRIYNKKIDDEDALLAENIRKEEDAMRKIWNKKRDGKDATAENLRKEDDAMRQIMIIKSDHVDAVAENMRRDEKTKDEIFRKQEDDMRKAGAKIRDRPNKLKKLRKLEAELKQFDIDAIEKKAADAQKDKDAEKAFKKLLKADKKQARKDRRAAKTEKIKAKFLEVDDGWTSKEEEDELRKIHKAKDFSGAVPGEPGGEPPTPPPTSESPEDKKIKIADEKAKIKADKARWKQEKKDEADRMKLWAAWFAGPAGARMGVRTAKSTLMLAAMKGLELSMNLLRFAFDPLLSGFTEIFNPVQDAWKNLGRSIALYFLPTIQKWSLDVNQWAMTAAKDAAMQNQLTFQTDKWENMDKTKLQAFATSMGIDTKAWYGLDYDRAQLVQLLKYEMGQKTGFDWYADYDSLTAEQQLLVMGTFQDEFNKWETGINEAEQARIDKLQDNTAALIELGQWIGGLFTGDTTVVQNDNTDTWFSQTVDWIADLNWWNK